MEIINQLAQPVLTLVLPVLAGALTAYVIKLWQTEKTKLNEKQLTLLYWIVNTEVWSAEQAYIAGILPANMRLKQVTASVQSWADKLGLKISVSAIVHLIEASVGEELNKEKILAPKVIRANMAKG